MKVVIRVDPERREWWKDTMSSLLPSYEFYLWDEDEFDKDSIDFAITWAPPQGMMASLKNLKCIFSVGAGISHITDVEDHPGSIPIVRTTGEGLRNRMCEYIALHVLRIHRRLPEIEAAAREGTWKQYVEPLASERTVGIMGMGNLGAACAQTLLNLGFNVKGLVRQGRKMDGVQLYTQDQYLEFCKDLDIAISLLPGTPETENIISQEMLQALPSSAWVINVGRGSQVNDDDLLEALDSGEISGAVLDVFRTEPLPSSHAFWNHPKVLITSHTASAIEPAVGGQLIAGNIKKFVAGEKIDDLVDLEQGY